MQENSLCAVYGCDLADYVMNHSENVITTKIVSKSLSK